ncbi:hypothetical protein [Fulvivirga sp.]|uniref:hypothetical protein n=1 Tax=Fulvivirga sp. TaxID=1931237 RepID=UPI0032EDFCDE
MKMRYTHSHKTTFRIPYNSLLASHKACKVLGTDLDLKIPFDENDKPKVFELETIAIDTIKKERISNVQLLEQDVSSGEALLSTLPFTQSESHLSFYHSIDQSLEIQNFSPYFKTFVHDRIQRILIFKNKGEDPVTIYSLHLSHSSFTYKDASFPVTLVQGERRKVEFSFQPKKQGVTACELIIRTSVLNHLEIIYFLTGNAVYGRSYYRIINGVRYDRHLMDRIFNEIEISPDKKVSFYIVNIIQRLIKDGYRFTITEKRTLQYVYDNCSWNYNVRQWFKSRFGFII